MFRAFSTIGVLSLVFLCCSGPVDHDDRLIFRYNEAAGITSLDPAFARSQANIWAVNQLFSGLVQMDRGLNVQPAIAKRWEVLDSGLTYVFHLRTDVSFHENECFSPSGSRNVKASDFQYSFERLLSKDIASPGAWVFQKVDHFSSPDDTTFVIRLKEPFPAFLGILSMKYCSVLPREAVDFYGDAFRENPVGTGAFHFKLWVANEKLVFRRNPYYFEKDADGQQLPYLEAVAISFIPDKQSAFLEFIMGKLDFISGIDASYKDELLSFEGELHPKHTNRFVLYKQPYLNTEYLGILQDSSADVMRTNPLRDRRVRQAINYGFDRGKMMKYLRNNIGLPASAGMVPAGMASHDPEKVVGYTYDKERALKLLEQAGYPNGKGLPEIVLQTNSSYLDLCEYIQGELSGLGIPLKVEVTPPSTLRQAMATSKSPFFRGSWIGDYPDAENYLSLFYSSNKAPNGPNYTHFHNEQFDQWYESASTQTNDSLRYLLYQRMDSLIIAEAPVVPLYYDQVLRFYPRTVTGLEGNAMNLLDLKSVRKN